MSNFTQVLEDLRTMQEDREEAVREAEVECRLADQALALAESSADIRTWAPDEREAWETAHYRVREAYNNLRKAREAL